MAITTLAMVATVFVLNLDQMKEKPMPGWAKVLFLNYVAKFLCMCNCAGPQNKPSDTESNMPDPHRERGRSRSRVTASGFLRRKSSAVPEEGATPLRSKSQDSAVTQRRSLVPPVESTVRDLSPGRYNVVFGDPRKYGMSGEKEKPKEKKQNFSKDWVHVAAVMDRLFFWMCLIFIVLTTLVLFHPITTSKLFKITFLDKAKEGE